MGNSNVIKEQNVRRVLCQEWNKDTVGALSDVSVLDAMHSGDIFIFPFNANNLTPIGYNFSPSEIIISTKTGLPLEINELGREEFVEVNSHDTILISTQEYLEVGAAIMGTFHSKVKIASAGFGHISTTLDPNWKGPLLIALNNPSSKKMRLVIRKDGKPVPFVSLVFYRLAQPAKRMHDNPPNRTDILGEYAANPSNLKKIFFAKQYKNYSNMLQMLNGTSYEKCIGIAGERKTKYDEILEKLETVVKEIQEITRIKGDYSKVLLHILNLMNEMEVHGISEGILYEMLCIIFQGVSYFVDEGVEWTGEDSFESTLMEYLFICLRHIEREKRGIIWEECYKECAKTIKEKKMYSVLMKMSIGIRWRECLLRIIVITILAVLFFVGVKQMLSLDLEEKLYETVILILGTTLFNIVSYHYARK